MTKIEYLDALERKLQPIDSAMIKAILMQYETIFSKGYNENKSDDVIIQEIGSTDFVADYYKTTLEVKIEPQKPVQKNVPQRPLGVSILRGIFVSFGLLMFNLVIVLAPYITVWSLIIAFFATGLAMALSGLAVILAMFIALPFNLSLPTLLLSHPVLLFAFSAIIISLGLIFILLCIMATKGFAKLSYKYFKWNFNMIRGDRYA